MQSSVSIRQASSSPDVETIAECFRTYTEWLSEDLTHQDYATELKALPGKYAAPNGALLLAVDSETDAPLGCIAMRPLDLPPSHPIMQQGAARCCEVKRLFVFPEARGRQVARKLVQEVIQRARDAKYHHIFLDSLSRMTAAIQLYRSEGFAEAAPYNESPLEGTVYYSKKLA